MSAPTIEIQLLSYTDRPDKVPAMPAEPDAADRAETWMREFGEWVLSQPDGNAIRLIAHLDANIELTTLLRCIVAGRAVLHMNEDRSWRVVVGEP